MKEILLRLELLSYKQTKRIRLRGPLRLILSRRGTALLGLSASVILVSANQIPGYVLKYITVNLAMLRRTRTSL